jgi:hypothetical protein
MLHLWGEILFDFRINFLCFLLSLFFNKYFFILCFGFDAFILWVLNWFMQPNYLLSLLRTLMISWFPNLIFQSAFFCSSSLWGVIVWDWTTGLRILLTESKPLKIGNTIFLLIHFCWSFSSPYSVWVSTPEYPRSIVL